MPTTLYTGAGNNVVNINGTTGPLTVVGEGGRDAVVVGNSGPTGPTLASIHGPVTIANAAPFTDLVIDDSGDPYAAQATLVNNGIAGQVSSDNPGPLAAVLGEPTFAEFLPAAIRYSNAGIHSLTVRGGSGGNYFLVAGTGTFLTTLDSGTGQDTLAVLGTIGPLNIDGQDGRDTVQVGQSPVSAGTCRSRAVPWPTSRGPFPS